jgi:hypothetical protein
MTATVRVISNHVLWGHPRMNEHRTVAGIQVVVVDESMGKQTTLPLFLREKMLVAKAVGKARVKMILTVRSHPKEVEAIQ